MNRSVIDESSQVNFILETLPKSFLQFRSNAVMNKIEYNLITLLNELQTYQSSMKIKGQDGKTNVASRNFHRGSTTGTEYGASSSSPKGKKKKVSGKGNKTGPVAAKKGKKAKVADKGKCFHCNVDGHWKRNCPKYLAEKKKEKEAIILGINSNPVLAKDASFKPSSENGIEQSGTIGLRKVEDGSVISNLHTSKWRVFTDNARDLFLQGRLEEAERYFISAIQEAKEGFGERDPHVASAFNNLAELYRVMKTFDKAEPMYLEAINILEESYGSEDIRVGSALHNLGQFYLVQRKLKEACNCYERALKIKGRVLGYGHVDYADTMYHLGTVLYLLGEEKDSEALIQDSIRILEEGGLGESILCIRRLRYLAKIHMKSNHLLEAENVQRKILHIMELSKGWRSLETINSADGLASTLYANGCLKEAQELLERCLDARKTLLPENHIQIGANMLHIARVVMLSSNELKATDISKAVIAIDKARELLNNSISISRGVLDKISKHGEKKKNHEDGEARRDGRTALLILLQSLDALGHLEITVQEMVVSKKDPSLVQAENVLFECISAYQKFKGSTFETPEVKAEYCACLKRLSNLINDDKTSSQMRRVSLEDLQDEISRLDVELSPHRRQKS